MRNQIRLWNLPISTWILITCLFYLSACKKDMDRPEPEPVPEPVGKLTIGEGVTEDDFEKFPGEVGFILNISLPGVKKARQRLRKKMDLSSPDSLENAVMDI